MDCPAALQAVVLQSTGNRLIEFKYRVDPCLVHYCSIQETSISRVFWSSPQIETVADSSGPPPSPGRRSSWNTASNIIPETVTEKSL